MNNEKLLTEVGKYLVWGWVFVANCLVIIQYEKLQDLTKQVDVQYNEIHSLLNAQSSDIVQLQQKVVTHKTNRTGEFE